MSQIQTFISAVGPAGPVETLTPDNGGAVAPVANNINIQAIPSVNGGNPDRLYALARLTSAVTADNPVMPAGTIKVEPLFDRVQSVNGALIEFPNALYALSPSQAVVFCANVIGNRDDYSAACGGYITGVAHRPAIGATVFVGEQPLLSSNAVPPDADFGFGLNGNTLQLFVQGVAGQTWNWTCTYTYQVQLL